MSYRPVSDGSERFAKNDLRLSYEKASTQGQGGDVPEFGRLPRCIPFADQRFRIIPVYCYVDAAALLYLNNCFDA
jgi:hypothetical protein